MNANTPIELQEEMDRLAEKLHDQIRHNAELHEQIVQLQAQLRRMRRGKASGNENLLRYTDNGQTAVNGSAGG